MNKVGYLGMRKTIKKYEIVAFLSWMREGSEEAFQYLSGLSDEALADALAAGMIVRTDHGQLFGSFTPVKLTEERLKRGLDMEQCADALRKKGAPKTFTRDSLDRIETNSTNRKNADFWVRHAAEDLFQMDWNELCAPISDGLIGPNLGCA